MLTLELEPELEARVRQAAEDNGVDAQTFVVQAVKDKLPPPDPMQRIMWNGLTAEEWLRQSEAWAESNRDWPVPPPEADERASFYEEPL